MYNQLVLNRSCPSRQYMYSPVHHSPHYSLLSLDTTAEYHWIFIITSVSLFVKILFAISFSFLNLKAYVICQIQEVFSSTLPSLSGTLIIGTLNLLHYQTPKDLFITAPRLFSFCCSDWINSDYKSHNFILGHLHSIIEPIQ